MGYDVDMHGYFELSKRPPKDIIKNLVTLRDKNIDSGYDMDERYLQELLNNKNIDAYWCPWEYDEDDNQFNTIYDLYECEHNYQFIDWIGWFIESICIPNNINMNGSCSWYEMSSNNDHKIYHDGKNGNGRLIVTNNKMEVEGKFKGSYSYKAVVDRINEMVQNRNKPKGDIKGTFCVTGKVSMSRDEFKKIGIEHGYEFKSSITNGLTYLICNDKNSTSSKVKKAKDSGIQIITEDEFVKFCEEGK